MLRVCVLTLAGCLSLAFVSETAFASGKEKPKKKVIEVYEIDEIVPDVVIVPSSMAVVGPAPVVVAPPAVVAPVVPGYYQQRVVRSPVPGFFNLTNASGMTAVSVTVWPSGACCQGPELLQASGKRYLHPGEMQSFSIPVNQGCLFDFKVEYAEDVEPTIIRNANLCASPGWTLTPPATCHSCY